MLINQTIATGYFPEELKLSRVKPLYKNRDSTLISNYRPISLLPSLSKVYERVIFDQLFQYMSNNNLLNISQYGFRPGHSTEFVNNQNILPYFKCRRIYFLRIYVSISTFYFFITQVFVDETTPRKYESSVLINHEN